MTEICLKVCFKKVEYLSCNFLKGAVNFVRGIKSFSYPRSIIGKINWDLS